MALGRLHWNHTGSCYLQLVFWCQSRAHLRNCNTARPLELRVHWVATGTKLADAITQWCPNGSPVGICITNTLEDHWKITRCTLGAHGCVCVCVCEEGGGNRLNQVLCFIFVERLIHTSLSLPFPILKEIYALVQKFTKFIRNSIMRGTDYIRRRRYVSSFFN